MACQSGVEYDDREFHRFDVSAGMRTVRERLVVEDGVTS
jgi:hypothetical protein